MLNPNDIAGKKFDRVMGRGYRADEVDSYLAQIAEQINELIEDKRDLEKKIMVLADKLEEYKEDEESLRAALLGAQKLGDSVVREAKANAKDIVEDAHAQANQLLENAAREIERQQSGFVRMQREVATFKSKLQLVYKQHLELISAIPVDENIVEAAKRRSAQQTAAAMREEPISPPPEDDEPLSPEPSMPESEPYDDDLPLPDDGAPLSYAEQTLEYTSDDLGFDTDSEPQQAQRESRFGPLKFGKEFDIKREDDNKRRK